MTAERRSALIRYYAIASVAVVGSGLLTRLPAVKAERGTVQLVLIVGVLLAAWAGGRKAGLVATALIAIATFRFGESVAWVVRHFMFIGAGLLISELVNKLDVARKRAEGAAARWAASEDRYRWIVETASEGIWVLDANGRSTYVNARAAEMIGRDPKELLGRTLGEFTYTPSGAEDLSQALSPLKSRRRTRFDLRLKRPDGAARWVRVSASTVSADANSGEGPGMLAMLSDVTDRVTAEEALRKSESRVRRIVESGMIGVAFLDAAGRVTEANDEFLRLFGSTHADVKAGRVTWSQSTPPEHREQDRRMLRDLRVYGSCLPFVKELTKADGGRYAVMVGATRLDPDGTSSPEGGGESVSFVLDVSAKRRAEEAVRLLAEAGEVLGRSLDVEATLSAFAKLAVPSLADICRIDVTGPDGQIRAVASETLNTTTEASGPPPRFLSESVEGLAGTSPVAEVIRTGIAVFAPEYTDVGPASSESQGGHLVPSRQVGMASVMVVPLTARGRTFGAVSLAVTQASRRYDAEDLALAEELARRAALAVDNARLFAEALQARLQAEAANRSKDQFLAALSHELRTPLTPVLVSVSAMLDDPETPEAFRSVLEVTRRNVALEARLIDDLLDVTRISRGKLRIERDVVDAHGLIRQAVAICRDETAAAGLRLMVSLDAKDFHVDGDPARLQQILWNLVKNAVKFTPEGGQIAVRSRNETVPENGTSLVVSIEDTGIGIDPEILPRIFNAFDQGDDSVTKQFGGLGLGLAISRSLAVAHDGALSASSRGKGQGSTFTLTLPTVPAPVIDESRRAAHPETRANGVPYETGPLRILLAEDNVDTLRIVARLLRSRGHTVSTADSVEAATTVASAEGPFDLLVSDIGLPDGSGYDLIRLLQPILGPIAGIALSGFGTEADRRKSKDAGFHVHLTKPVDFATLETAIKKVAVVSSTP